jgi:tRNA threonylcarbamoyladenosine biosynthesis protein TsaE
MEFIFSLNQIESVAAQLLQNAPQKVILFHGEMGTGKTTFIKALAKQLGVVGATSSPTFSLVNEYEAHNNQLIYHFDFYRLKTETEALDMGADEYFYSGHWCFIEWAQNIPNLIPENHSVVTIKTQQDGTRILAFN